MKKVGSDITPITTSHLNNFWEFFFSISYYFLIITINSALSFKTTFLLSLSLSLLFPSSLMPSFIFLIYFISQQLACNKNSANDERNRILFLSLESYTHSLPFFFINLTFFLNHHNFFHSLGQKNFLHSSLFFPPPLSPHHLLSLFILIHNSWCTIKIVLMVNSME